MQEEALVGIDTDGNIIQWSIEASALLGWTHKEAFGQPMAELIIPERHRSQHHMGMRLWKETGEGPILGEWLDTEALHADGHEVPIRFAPWAVIVAGEQRFYAALQRLERRARPRPDADE